MRLRRAIGALCLAGSLPLRARASEIDEARLAVARSSDALSCPDDEVLAARVRQLRQGKGAAPALRIEVMIERTSGGHRARIQVNGPRSGVRELQADGDACGGLSDALSVSLALMLDEEAAAQAPPAAPTAPTTAPTPSPPLPAARVGSFRAPPPPGPRLWLGVEGGAALGLPDPGVSPVMQGGLRLDTDGLRFGLRLAWSPEATQSFRDGQVDVGLWRAELDGCARALGSPTWELGGCALASVGQITGQGRGFAPDRAVDRPYYALGAAALARGPLLSWLNWTARAALLVPLHRERFVVDEQGVAYKLPGAGAALTAGIEARVW